MFVDLRIVPATACHAAISSKSALLGMGGLTLADHLRFKAAAAATGQTTQRHHRHSHLVRRRPEPHRHVRSQAERSGRVSRRVQRDPDQRVRHPHRRTSAAAGPAHGQDEHRPLRDAHQCRARHGLPLDADRLRADHRNQRQSQPQLRLHRFQDARGQRSPAAGLCVRAQPAAKRQCRLPGRGLQSVHPRRRPNAAQLRGARPASCRWMPTGSAIAGS